MTRILKWSILFLTLLALALETAHCKFVQGTGEWSHELDLDSENGIRVKWKNSPPENGKDRWITMQVFARVKGYVGVGFSPHGGMAGADMVIGWVDPNGFAHLKDFYGVANTKPLLDESQDYELLSAKEDEEGTTVMFRRKWETCDDNDMAIVNDTMRLIWATSQTDPVMDGGSLSSLEWHGTKSRGVVSAFMVADMYAAKFPDDDDPHVKHWDMTVTDNVVDPEHTVYFCKLIKVPPAVQERKHQMIGYKPILTPGNEKRVHHIVFYECVIPEGYGDTVETFEKHLNHPGGKCYTPNMPPEWHTNCVTFLFAWVAGSQGEMFPDHVGSPLGDGHGGSTYFMLQIHYDNPEQIEFKDSSGVRLYYTDKVRPNDGKVILLGYRVTPFLLLPPKQNKFMTYGICSAQCTQKTVPKEGINVIISMVHAHTFGRKIRLRHIRNGKELPMIAEDNHYDFNYQQSRSLKNEVKVMPGDELLVECEFETKNNDRIVLGGLSTRQEMCETFVMYYPVIDVMQCTSQYEFHDFFNALGIEKVSGSVLEAIKMPYNPEGEFFDPPDNAMELEESGDGQSYRSVYDHIIIESPEKWRGVSVGDYLKRVNWTHNDHQFGKEVEAKWKASKHYAFCTGHGRTRQALDNHIIPFTKITEPLPKPEPACNRIDGLLSRSGVGKFVFSPILGVIALTLMASL